MHSVAYQGGLGSPLICPEGCLPNLNADVLAEFYANNYTAPRMVLAAGGWRLQLHIQWSRLASQPPQVPTCLPAWLWVVCSRRGAQRAGEAGGAPDVCGPQRLGVRAPLAICGR